MNVKIHRRCACGCGGITNYGKKWLQGHSSRSMSKEHRKHLSSALMGNTCSKGRKLSEEHKFKIGLSQLKFHSEDEYCEAWRDRGYRKDIRKDYCESVDCKCIYKRLDNHHINLNKKDCRPVNVMTLCCPCHSSFHHKLKEIENKRIVHPKNFLIINRNDHISYIHKQTKRRIKIERRI